MRPPAAKGATTSKFPHIANYTGRPSTIATNIVSGRDKTSMGITRPATSKFPHIANYTGRLSTIATNIVSGRDKTGMGITRPAMSDRTNSQRKLSDETNNGKVSRH